MLSNDAADESTGFGLEEVGCIVGFPLHLQPMPVSRGAAKGWFRMQDRVGTQVKLGWMVGFVGHRDDVEPFIDPG